MHLGKQVSPKICVGQFNHQNYIGTRCKPNSLSNPEQVDDASTLAEGLQNVALVPKTTTRSVPDVTMSLLVDQKVLTDSHPTSF